MPIQIDTRPAYHENRSVLRSFLPGPLPAGWGVAMREAQERELTAPPARHSDPGIQAILDQILERQRKAQESIKNMTPGDMAFAVMRNVPRDQWNVPLTKLGHWPRGSTVAEIKRTPALMNYTPMQVIIQLFEMDSAHSRALAEKGK